MASLVELIKLFDTEGPDSETFQRQLKALNLTLEEFQKKSRKYRGLAYGTLGGGLRDA